MTITLPARVAAAAGRASYAAAVTECNDDNVADDEYPA